MVFGDTAVEWAISQSHTDRVKLFAGGSYFTTTSHAFSCLLVRAFDLANGRRCLLLRVCAVQWARARPASIRAEVLQDMTDEGTANLLEKLLSVDSGVLGRITRAALRSAVRRLSRSGGPPESGR